MDKVIAAIVGLTTDGLSVLTTDKTAFGVLMPRLQDMRQPPTSCADRLPRVPWMMARKSHCSRADCGHGLVLHDVHGPNDPPRHATTHGNTLHPNELTMQSSQKTKQL